MLDIIFIGIGLSMDAFAVAICKGLPMKRLHMAQAVVIGLYFGGFQAWMPTLGWLLGSRFRQYIEKIDHWIAFALLALIGGKMILEGVRSAAKKTDASVEQPVVAEDRPLDHKELLMLAIATSIDALAVGISFAAIGTPIFPSALLIGCITFGISVGGVAVGYRFGNRFEKKAEIVGGIILVIIGIKVLIEHA